MATYIITMHYTRHHIFGSSIRSEIIGICKSFDEAESYMRDYISKERENMEVLCRTLEEFDIQEWELDENRRTNMWYYDRIGIRY